MCATIHGEIKITISVLREKYASRVEKSQINHNCTTLAVEKKKQKTRDKRSDGQTSDRCFTFSTVHENSIHGKKSSPYSITERRVPELIPVLGSQPAGDVSHKPGGRQPLLSARPAVTLATLKRAATNFAAW